MIRPLQGSSSIFAEVSALELPLHRPCKYIALAFLGFVSECGISTDADNNSANASIATRMRQGQMRRLYPQSIDTETIGRLPCHQAEQLTLLDALADKPAGQPCQAQPGGGSIRDCLQIIETQSTIGNDFDRFCALLWEQPAVQLTRTHVGKLFMCSEIIDGFR